MGAMIWNWNSHASVFLCILARREFLIYTLILRVVVIHFQIKRLRYKAKVVQLPFH